MLRRQITHYNERDHVNTINLFEPPDCDLALCALARWRPSPMQRPTLFSRTNSASRGRDRSIGSAWRLADLGTDQAHSRKSKAKVRSNGRAGRLEDHGTPVGWPGGWAHGAERSLRPWQYFDTLADSVADGGSSSRDRRLCEHTELLAQNGSLESFGTRSHTVSGSQSSRKIQRLRTPYSSAADGDHSG